MSYPIKYPTPQGANIQISQRANTYSDWVKPQGASFVWFTLIGGGSSGDGTNGGCSAAVTNCMVPAFLVPDVLRVYVGKGGAAGTSGISTFVEYQQKDGAGYRVLTANGGPNTNGGGAASASNYFSCMGLFQSIQGQSGVTGGQSASATTFLSGGCSTGPNTSNYGYSATQGFSQVSPIIVGVGGVGTGIGGVGCGGGENGKGGDGLAVIITW